LASSTSHPSQRQNWNSRNSSYQKILTAWDQAVDDFLVGLVYLISSLLPGRQDLLIHGSKSPYMLLGGELLCWWNPVKTECVDYSFISEPFNAGGILWRIVSCLH
jgi:hypothetical protein